MCKTSCIYCIDIYVLYIFLVLCVVMCVFCYVCVCVDALRRSVFGIVVLFMLSTSRLNHRCIRDFNERFSSMYFFKR